VCVCVCVCAVPIVRALQSADKKYHIIPIYIAADEHAHARNGNGDARIIIIIIIYGSPFLWKGGSPYALGTLSKLLCVLEKNRSLGV
jgi:hypothetical protein